MKSASKPLAGSRYLESAALGGEKSQIMTVSSPLLAHKSVTFIESLRAGSRAMLTWPWIRRHFQLYAVERGTLY